MLRLAGIDVLRNRRQVMSQVATVAPVGAVFWAAVGTVQLIVRSAAPCTGLETGCDTAHRYLSVRLMIRREGLS